MNDIVIDGRMFYHSGIGTYLRQLVNCLSDRFDISVIGSKELFDNDYSGKIINSDCGIYSLREQVELPLKIPRCKIFLAPHYNIPILNVKSGKKITVIHDVFHLAFRKTLSIQQKLYATLMINTAVRLSDIIITVSEFSKNEIIKYTGIKESKIKVIHFGFDKDKYNRITHSGTIRQKYSLPDNYILFVGNLKPHKNIEMLLKAYDLILHSNTKTKLVIIGKKEGLLTSDSKIFDLINKNDLLKENTFFTGYVHNSDLPQIYSMAKLFVFPSIYEGFGIPPLEAMACGCPVIASNIPPIKEVCSDSVVFFDPYDINDISYKINSLLNDDDKRKELVQKGFDNLNRFTTDKFAENWIQIINTLI